MIDILVADKKSVQPQTFQFYPRHLLTKEEKSKKKLAGIFTVK